jgi:hypothetical protein
VKESGGGGDEEDSKPHLATSSAARTGSHSDDEVVQEQVMTPGETPRGWMHVKLEPDCQSPNPRCKDGVRHRLQVAKTASDVDSTHAFVKNQ